MSSRSRSLARDVIGTVALVLAAATCGGENGARQESAPAPLPATTTSDLSADELRYGIGPVRDLSLAAVDPALAGQGAEVFALKCSACHKIEERYVGPPLADVLERRTPEFVMNMMLNPDEMVAKHPDVKKMLAEYFTPMPNQQLTTEDARAVLEYLRAPSSIE